MLCTVELHTLQRAYLLSVCSAVCLLSVCSAVAQKGWQLLAGLLRKRQRGYIWIRWCFESYFLVACGVWRCNMASWRDVCVSGLEVGAGCEPCKSCGGWQTCSPYLGANRMAAKHAPAAIGNTRQVHL